MSAATCWVCSGDPAACRCPLRPREEWVQITAGDLPTYRGCRVSIHPPVPGEVPDRLTYAVVEGQAVNLATRDGRRYLPADVPVWVQADHFPTVESGCGEQHFLPLI